MEQTTQNPIFTRGQPVRVAATATNGWAHEIGVIYNPVPDVNRSVIVALPKREINAWGRRQRVGTVHVAMDTSDLIPLPENKR